MSNVEMGKTYKTRSGLSVRVLCTDRASSDFPVIALVDEDELNGGGDVMSFMADGKYSKAGTISSHTYDLIKWNAWSDVAVDAKILVRDSDGESWEPAHFAAIDGSGVLAWRFGATSHTTTKVVSWKFAKLT